jgi:hypothetical protein
MTVLVSLFSQTLCRFNSYQIVRSGAKVQEGQSGVKKNEGIARAIGVSALYYPAPRGDD